MIKRTLSLFLCIAISFSFCMSVCAEDVTEEELQELEEQWQFEEEQNADQDASDDALYGGSDDEVVDDSVAVAEPAVSNTFSDITDSKTARVVETLNGLGFINGYEDGTFRPNNTISRAEFITVIIRTLNMKDTEVAVGGYDFYDTTPGSWEYNVMSYAVKNDLLTVYNDNTVRPYEPITYKQAIVAYLKVMGYEAVAEFDGGYTYGYENIANKLDLDEGINNTEPLKRDAAARLILNCIKAPINKQFYYGEMVSFSNEHGDNILSHYHDIYYSTGVVKANWLSGTDDYAATSPGLLNIGGALYRIEDNSYATLLGYKVEYYYKNNDNDINKVLVLHKHPRVEELTVKSDRIQNYSNGVFKYYTEEGKLRSVQISDDHTFIKNGKISDDYSSVDFKPERGYVTLVSNGGLNYDTVYVYEYFNVVADSVSAMDGVLYVTMLYGSKALQLDLDSRELYIDMYTDSTKMNVNIRTETYTDGNGSQQIRTILPNIPKNSVISVFSDEFDTTNGEKTVAKEAKYVRIVINTPSIIGTIDYTSTGVVGIKGNEYSIATDNFLDEEDSVFKAGSNGKFLFDFNGELVAWMPVVNSNNYVYGYLINAVKQRGMSNVVDAKVLTANGDIVICTMDKKTYINDDRSDTCDEIITRLKASARLIDETSTGVSQLVKYIANEDNYIKKLQIVTSNIGVATGYDEKIQLKRDTEKTVMSYRSSLGHIFVNKTVAVDKADAVTNSVSNTNIAISTYAGQPDVIFCVPTTATLDDDDYEVITTWLPSTSYKTTELYDVNSMLQPGAAIVYEDTTTLPTFANPILLVENVSWVLDEEENETIQISGWQGAMEFSYIAESPSVVSHVKAGDIVMLQGSDEIIEKCEVITSIKEVLGYDYSISKPYIISPETVPQKGAITFSVYEAYATDAANKIVMLHRGGDTDGDGMREFMRTSYWHPKSSSFHYGATLCNYDISTNKFSLSSGAIANINGSMSYGHGASSKILIGEQTGYNIRYMLIINVN